MKKISRLICTLLMAGSCIMQAYAQENVTFFLHTIEKGQSLYSIASMYGISQADIVRLNPGTDERIYAGQTLRIPQSTDNTLAPTFHTIVEGETLYSLTRRYHTTAKAICDANPGLSAQNFRAGQVICIPVADKNLATEDKKSAPQQNVQNPAESPCRDMHKVKRRETVFSISRKYGITEEQLIAANPEIKDKEKLDRGSWLCIPYPQKQTEQTPTQEPARIPTDAELFQANTEKARRFKSIKAAIVLPFYDVVQSEAARMIEYYEGFLMAVDSLKRTGTSIDLYTYNSGNESASLSTLLSKPEMKQMDIIFGPLYQSHIQPLADFAQKNDIRLVIPFTSKDNTVFRNPNVYQINTPQSYLYSEVYDHFLRQFAGANVIFIEASQGTRDKAEFIKGLKEELRRKGITTSSLKEDATTESLKSVLAAGRENVFIPTSGTNVTLINLLPKLTMLVREVPEQSIHLFGYPEWQTYTKDHLDAFFELDTYFYSSFYTNNLLPAAVHFTKSYQKWYGKDMDERYPKFGMLGFDTGYFFLKGLSNYGSEFEKDIQQLDLIPIQTGFKFQRVNNWGGFINRKVFFVHFTKNFELLKLDFD
ncbi:LysM peptidoglycan-binding domain-containing protein [Bacteroidales bacterium SW292]|uniref:PBP1 and LysM peptidoglycan-binding domain-containing protein n=1 Tax=Mediterranea sp. An20 TaxID=1965586 RepID=UPI000B3A7E73|nr:LysM peptidoglycan-binding domain-containing protein [Mediterranea sp. An20]MBW9201752.1 LysM peptidoglycan-binding domain-containing protein [Bacteroidales bacterium SW292]OUP06289.1 peptidase M23 [Mediterranea sp. An20]